MKRSNYLLLLLLASFTVLSLPPTDVRAEKFTASWTHPTQYVNGDPLPIEEIANTMLFWEPGNATCTKSSLEASANTLIVQSPLASAEVEPVNPGEWCVAARTVSVEGAMSDLTDVIFVDVFRDPRSPTGLTTAQNSTVYRIFQSDDALALVPIGNAPPGVQCDPDIVISDRNGVLAYQIPRDTVTWFNQNTQAEVVFAQCGS